MEMNAMEVYRRVTSKRCGGQSFTRSSWEPSRTVASSTKLISYFRTEISMDIDEEGFDASAAARLRPEIERVIDEVATRFSKEWKDVCEVKGAGIWRSGPVLLQVDRRAARKRQ